MPLACCQPLRSRSVSCLIPTAQSIRSRRQESHRPCCSSGDKHPAKATPVLQRRLLLLVPPLAAAASAVLQPAPSSAVGIPDVLSQGLKKQLGQLQS